MRACEEQRSYEDVGNDIAAPSRQRRKVFNRVNYGTAIAGEVLDGDGEAEAA